MSKLEVVATEYEIRYAPEEYWPGVRVETLEIANAVVADLKRRVPGLTVEIAKVQTHRGEVGALAVACLDEWTSTVLDLFDYTPNVADDEDDLDMVAWRTSVMTP